MDTELDTEFVEWWNENWAGKYRALINPFYLAKAAYLLGKTIERNYQIENQIRKAKIEKAIKDLEKQEADIRRRIEELRSL